MVYLDAILVPIGLAILLAYQVFTLWRVRTTPLRTVVGVNHLARRQWVYSMMKDNDKKNIVAVQTLRNTIMVSTLMASTAILMSSATGVFMSSSYFSTKNPLLGGQNQTLLNFKYMSLIACFLFSFLCFMQSVRYIGHVNFLINIPVVEGTVIRISPDFVANVLAKGCNFFTIGTRGLYVAFPFFFWLFSPICVLLSCVGLVPVLYFLDSAHLDSDDEFIQKSLRRNSISPLLQTGQNSHDFVRKSSDQWETVELTIRSAQEQLSR